MYIILVSYAGRGLTLSDAGTSIQLDAASTPLAGLQVCGGQEEEIGVDIQSTFNPALHRQADGDVHYYPSLASLVWAEPRG